MEFNRINTIIFDLGGVVINLDTHRSFEAFAKLGGISTDELYKRLENYNILHEYEKGHLSDEDFRQSIKRVLETEAPDKAIDEAWSAMLLDIPTNRMILIDKLKKLGYNLFVLSNTNAIHIRYFNQIMEAAHGYRDLDDIFDKAYYSHHLQMRKPDADIFEKVLEMENLYPENTLFLDDTEANIKTAKQLNMQTAHITPDNSIIDVFKPLMDKA